jgi:hypothetical protein
LMWQMLQWRGIWPLVIFSPLSFFCAVSPAFSLPVRVCAVGKEKILSPPLRVCCLNTQRDCMLCFFCNGSETSYGADRFLNLLSESLCYRKEKEPSPLLFEWLRVSHTPLSSFLSHCSFSLSLSTPSFQFICPCKILYCVPYGLCSFLPLSISELSLRL